MQRPDITLLQGGLDLVTPLVAMPSGRVIAGLNYEPDVAGYRRMGGYERFDGRPSPHQGVDAAEVAARRAAIGPVPGSGPVRGVVIYNGHVWAFRDAVSGEGAMYKATPSGWEQQTFGHVVFFVNGTVEFEQGETLSGATSSATARIERAVTRTGSYSGGDAAGYLVLSGLIGAFENGEALSGSLGGAASCSGFQSIMLSPGGQYEFAIYNFFGAADRKRLYFTNGVNEAMEWDGTNLSPIFSGTDRGPLDLAGFLLNRTGGNITNRDGGRIYLRTNFDLPLYVAQFQNHLFLAFRNGSVVFSATGEPLDYQTAGGAGEFGFGDEITGFLPAAQSAFVILGRDRVSYLTGQDAQTFVLNPLSDGSGAFPRTAQMLDQPVYLDDSGIRGLSTTDAFGDWRLGTITRPIEPLFRRQRTNDVRPVASLKVRGRDQYRLYYEDGTGVVVYLGREQPESMPMRLPVTFTCAWAGEINPAQGGERLFAGASDGFVYELDVGTSFDGAPVEAFVRLAWNNVRLASQNKRFVKLALEMDAPTDVSLGIAYEFDYGRSGPVNAAQRAEAVLAGDRQGVTLQPYSTLIFAPSQGVLETHIDGFGRNVAISIISHSATEEPHTLSSMTMNYAPRGMIR